MPPVPPPPLAPRRRRRRLRAWPAALALAWAPAGAWAAGAQDLLYERTLVAAAGARCALFTPDIARALTAAARQAEGAALRGGAEAADLSALKTRARARAAGLACASPDLAKVAARVKTGFAGYSRIGALSFQGWRADRNAGIGRTPGWRLLQTARTPSGPLSLGVAAEQNVSIVTAVAGWARAKGAAGARLVMRDPLRAPQPYLDTRPGATPGLAEPPPEAVLTILASDRIDAPASLLPPDVRAGAAFRFPAYAARALDALDPRESAVLELVYPVRSGEEVERLRFAVGDFAAARAFLAAGR